MAKERRRLIDEDLLKAWQQLKRVGDAEAIATLLGVSKPTIENALIYGHVHQDRIINGINTFFSDRLQKEKQMAGELRQLATE